MLQSKTLVNEITVRQQEFFIKSSDKKQLFGQCWDAGIHTYAVVLLIHGLGEHSSRYDQWSRRFSESGVSVLSFDLRGHGKTPGKVASETNYNRLLRDIDVFVRKGKELYKDKPVFIYGHSFGGNLVSNFAITRVPNVSGLILTSPWFKVVSPPPRLKFIAAKILSRIAPGIRAKTGLRAEDMSKELRDVHLYRKDPLVHNRISARLFIDAYEKGLLARKSIYKINVPLLVLHGSADKITSCNASREFVMNSGDKTTFVEIEGGYHELHNDSEKDRVFEIIMKWIKDKITI